MSRSLPRWQRSRQPGLSGTWFNEVRPKRGSVIKTTLFILLLCLIGIGFYRGWFALSSHGGDGEGNKVGINFTVDPDKAKADVEGAKDKAIGLGDQARNKVKPGS